MNSEIREHEARRPGGTLIAKTQVFVSGCGYIRIFTVIGAGYELKADVFKYVKSLTDTLNSYKLKPEALEAVSDLMKVYIDELPILLEDYEPHYLDRPDTTNLPNGDIYCNSDTDIDTPMVSGQNN